jgi:transposase
LIDKMSNTPNLPHLHTSEGGEKYYGKSVSISMALERPGESPRHSWLRLLVVYSSHLAERKQGARQKAVAKERKTLDSQVKKLEKMDFACKADALKVSTRDLKAAKAKLHQMSVGITTAVMEIKRRGQPPKQARPLSTKTVWRVQIGIQEIPRLTRPYDPDGFFILATSITDHRRKSDAELLKVYKEQHVVEIGFKWLKGPLAVKPVFLELPTRIQSLGLILLLGVLFAALLQREVRRALKNRGGTVANYHYKRSATPTWMGIMSLFERVRITKVLIAGEVHQSIQGLDADQIEILTLLGIPDVYEDYSNAVYD